MVSPMDKLIFYAILMCAVSIIVRFTYGHYCKKHFTECTYHFHWDKEILMKMFGFAGWNFIGAASGVLRDQGGNIVINLFFGPAVNAARGIATQVNAAVVGFINNFMTALNPQITKSYASGDKEYMLTLIYQGARLSFYLLLFLSLPILVNTHYILVLWLKILPNYAVLFVQLTLCFALSESVSQPLITAMLATGNIKRYQIIVGGLQLMNLPISYMFLKMGFPPQCVLVVAIIISQLCLVARLYLLRKMIGISFMRFMRKVYLNVTVVTICSIIIPIVVSQGLSENFCSFVVLTIIVVFCTSLSILFIGCDFKERCLIREQVYKLRQRISKRKI